MNENKAISDLLKRISDSEFEVEKEERIIEEIRRRFEIKETVINELLTRVFNLEFEVEKLEKNEQYKYINGQAYFRQDYVLGREKEIDRLNNIINKLQNYLSSKKEMIEVELILDKLQELKGSDKE